jgi:hypothetical protein
MLDTVGLLSQRPQEGEESFLVLWRKAQPEFMASHSPRFQPVPNETSGHVVVPEPLGVEPILERSDRAVMLKGPPVPHTLERRHLVVAHTAPRF